MFAPHAAIATSHPLASTAGLRVLDRGGNAVDAAVAAAAILSVVEPHMTGIGGDVFAMIWFARERKLVGLNASGRSGSTMSREVFIGRNRQAVPEHGAESVTVPGAVSGWVALLERYGTLNLARVLEPAVALAGRGFPVSPVVARQWAGEVAKLRCDDAARGTFLVEGGRSPQTGEWFRNPDLADSLALLSEQGAGAMYGGDLGSRISQHVRELGGFLSDADLRNHTVDWVDPLMVEFEGHRIWELPPVTQGVAVLEMLRIIDPFELRGMGHNSAPYLHHLIEAKKLAFEDLESRVGEPAAMIMPPHSLLEEAFIRGRRAHLDPTSAADLGGMGQSGPGDTVYLSVADRDGNLVSFVNSLFHGFGSGVVVPRTGFALHNRGTGFSLAANTPNTVGPRKRPLHTLIPGFVTRVDGSGQEGPELSFGVMGGSMQPQGHVQLLLNLLLFGMDLQEAVDAPRFRHVESRRLALEAPIPDQVRTVLAALGHDIISESDVFFGGAQAVMRWNEGWAAASDPRKDGVAVGH